MAIVLKRDISQTGLLQNAYFRIGYFNVMSDPVGFDITLQIYASKERREKEIMINYIAKHIELSTPKDMTGFVIDRDFQTLLSITDDAQYIDLFSKCYYTQEQMKELFDDGIGMNVSKPIQEWNWCIYKQDNLSDFPTQLDISTIKSWLYEKFKSDRYSGVINSPRCKGQTFIDDTESEQTVIDRYKNKFKFIP